MTRSGLVSCDVPDRRCRDKRAAYKKFCWPNREFRFAFATSRCCTHIASSLPPAQIRSSSFLRSAPALHRLALLTGAPSRAPGSRVPPKERGGGFDGDTLRVHSSRQMLHDADQRADQVQQQRYLFRLKPFYHLHGRGGHLLSLHEQGFAIRGEGRCNLSSRSTRSF